MSQLPQPQLGPKGNTKDKNRMKQELNNMTRDYRPCSISSASVDPHKTKQQHYQ